MTDATDLDPEPTAIRTEMQQLNEGSPAYAAAHARLEAWYQAKYPPSAPNVATRETAPAPPPPPGPAPLTLAEQTAAIWNAPWKVNETDDDRLAQVKALWESQPSPEATPPGETPAPTSDPAIAVLEAELRDMRPDTAAWAAKVDEIDARVLAQPVRADDVTEMQGAADGIALAGGATWDTTELARAMNVARFNIGEQTAEQVVVSGMVTIQRALQDAEAGVRYESWDDVVDGLAAEWGSDGERRVQDIREALGKFPRLRADLLRSKLIYHPAVLRYLADVGGRIPLGPA
jgi:hypothetical protein